MPTDTRTETLRLCSGGQTTARVFKWCVILSHLQFQTGTEKQWGHQGTTDRAHARLCVCVSVHNTTKHLTFTELNPLNISLADHRIGYSAFVRSRESVGFCFCCLNANKFKELKEQMCCFGTDASSSVGTHCPQRSDWSRVRSLSTWIIWICKATSNKCTVME